MIVFTLKYAPKCDGILNSYTNQIKLYMVVTLGAFWKNREIYTLN